MIKNAPCPNTSPMLMSISLLKPTAYSQTHCILMQCQGGLGKFCGGEESFGQN